VTWMESARPQAERRSGRRGGALGALGVFCLLQLARVNRTTTQIATQSLPSVKGVSDITPYGQLPARGVPAHPIVHDEERAQYEQGDERPSSTTSSEPGHLRALIARTTKRPPLRRVHEPVVRLHDRALEVMELSADGKRDEARAVMGGHRHDAATCRRRQVVGARRSRIAGVRRKRASKGTASTSRPAVSSSG